MRLTQGWGTYTDSDKKIIWVIPETEGKKTNVKLDTGSALSLYR